MHFSSHVVCSARDEPAISTTNAPKSMGQSLMEARLSCCKPKKGSQIQSFIDSTPLKLKSQMSPTKGNSYFVSLFGAVVAATSGSCLGWGHSLLFDESYEKATKKAAGGGLLVLGMYLFAPTFLRHLWLASPGKMY
jgi:hypothetical protein